MDNIKREIENKIKSLENSNSKLYNILNRIIIKNDWIEEIPLDVFINMLDALGYSKETSIEYYKAISIEVSKKSIESYKGDENESIQIWR